MASVLDVSAARRLRGRLDRLAVAPDAGPLMVSLMRIIVEDNRAGVLAGRDKYGALVLAVGYRPMGRGRRTTWAQRNLAAARDRFGVFAGLGMSPGGRLHNNLSHAEYERLAGPPLAPRRQFSRVITNLKTGYGRISGTAWEAFGYWDQVVDTRGRPFLHAHFTGAATGRNHRTILPERDLRGVRPEGLAKARGAARAWARDLLRSTP